MRTIGVIPARYASSRFPAKVLARIAGKPMIQHVWEKATRCQCLNDVLIACDHEEVLRAALAFGAKAVMTDPGLASGSDRIAAAVKDLDVGVVVNIQGDEPFVDPAVIDALVHLLTDDPGCLMGTVIKQIVNAADVSDPNVVKCVVDEKGYALYFSRAAIPYNRNAALPTGATYYKHLGLYAYRKDFLMQMTQWSKGRLESIEQLEQLRVLEHGYKIKTTLTTYDSIAVDTPADLMKAEAWCARLK